MKKKTVKSKNLRIDRFFIFLSFVTVYVSSDDVISLFIRRLTTQEKDFTQDDLRERERERERGARVVKKKYDESSS